MIAQVYPVLRLPRRFDVFDYSIPEELDVKAGDLVAIPFRGQEVLGVVRRIAKTSSVKRLSKIHASVVTNFYNTHDLERIDKVARSIITTPSQLYYFLLHDFGAVKRGSIVQTPAHRNLTLNKNDAEVVTKTLRDTNIDFAQLSLEGQIALAFQAIKKGKTLIIVPNPRLAEQVAQSLGVPVLTSKTPKLKKRETIMHWQTSGKGGLVATRLGSLLPTAGAKFVLVLERTSSDYEFLERNPRFLAPLVAALMKNSKTRVIESDTFPPLLSLNPCLQSPPPVRIVNLKETAQKTTHPLLSETVLEETDMALQSGKTVLYFLNRNQDSTTEKASATVLKALEARFGKTMIGELSEKKSESSRPLILATDITLKQAFVPFRKYADLVVDIFPDLGLQNVEVTSTEERARRLYQITAFARSQNAPCILQTYNPTYFLTMLETDAFLNDLRLTRERYKQIPFNQTYTVTPAIEVPFDSLTTNNVTTITINQENEERLRDHLFTLDDSYIIESQLSTYDT